jgi:hypothetical protein
MYFNGKRGFMTKICKFGAIVLSCLKFMVSAIAKIAVFFIERKEAWSVFFFNMAVVSFGGAVLTRDDITLGLALMVVFSVFGSLLTKGGKL